MTACILGSVVVGKAYSIDITPQEEWAKGIVVTCGRRGTDHTDLETVEILIELE